MAKHKKNKGKKLKGLVRVTTSNGRVFIVEGKEYKSRSDIRNGNYVGKVFATPAEPVEFDETIKEEVVAPTE